MASTQCVLSCGCVRHYPTENAPKAGDYVYCLYHSDGVMVIEGIPQFRIQCTKCRYGRQFGRNKELAIRRASDHLLRNGTHVVKVYDGNNLIDAITIANAPKLLDIPEDHQRSLRNLYWQSKGFEN